MKINCQTYGFRNNRDWHRWERETQQRVAQMDSGELIEETIELANGDTYDGGFTSRGLGKDYVGNDEFAGIKGWATSVILMARDGKKYEMSLGGFYEKDKGMEEMAVSEEEG